MLLGTALAARAEIEPDEHGQILTLPAAAGPHWVWVPDRLMHHSVLFDGDSGRVLGTLDGAWTLSGPAPLLAPGRGEIVVVDAVYDRGHRGTRRDFATIYDAVTLAVRDEVEIPPRAASVGHGIALAAVLDDPRFVVVFNQDPSNSVSVVDLEGRRFVEEIVVAGCALVYPVGGRRFGTLCGDGTALVVELDADGRHARSGRSEPFFDPVTDPLTEKGVRDGARWLFASFEGYLHEVDFAGPGPVLARRWSLFGDDERQDGWRVGGMQHVALHRASRRLYSIVHQGGAGSHKDPGTAIWVYDLDRRARTEVLELATLLPAFLGPLLGIAPGSWWDWLLGVTLPNPGVHSIAVTQDEAPLLFVRHDEIGAVGVHDALTGARLRTLDEAGISGPTLVVYE